MLGRPWTVDACANNLPVMSFVVAYNYPLPPCISYANVHNYYGPYAYCSIDKSVACAQHIRLPTHTCAGHMC